MLFDSHTHIHFPVYDKDRKDVIERAKKAGVKMITVGTQAASSEAAIKLAREYPEDIWATVGFHPNHVVLAQHTQINADSNADLRGWYHDKKEQKEAEPEKFDAGKLRELARDPKVVAIGECGLDYYRLVTSNKEQVTSNKELQKEVFLEQAKLAHEVGKALMIHCRPSKGTDDAYEDILQIMPNVKGQMSKVVHFYVGSLAITKKLLDAGFYFTFGGVITFARDYDESIKYIPMDRILSETDAPYVTPEPYRGKPRHQIEHFSSQPFSSSQDQELARNRFAVKSGLVTGKDRKTEVLGSVRGKRNEPAYVVEVVKKLAELKGVSTEVMRDQIFNNARKIFKF